MCVCLGGGGATPVQVKDPIILIHGSLEGSSPYKTGVYIEYLLIILERNCSSMQRKKGRQSQTTALNASDESCFSIQASLAAPLRTMGLK